MLATVPSMTTQPTPTPSTPTAPKFYYRSRPVRQSGTTVTVGHADDIGLEANADGAWFTICVDHSTTVRQPGLRIASAQASQPASWCKVCAKNVAKNVVPARTSKRDAAAAAEHEAIAAAEQAAGVAAERKAAAAAKRQRSVPSKGDLEVSKALTAILSTPKRTRKVAK